MDLIYVRYPTQLLNFCCALEFEIIIIGTGFYRISLLAPKAGDVVSPYGSTPDSATITPIEESVRDSSA